MPRIPDNEDSFGDDGSDFIGDPQFLAPSEGLTASGAPFLGTTLSESDDGDED